MYEDDGYYISKEDALAYIRYTKAHIRFVEKKAIKRLQMTDEDKNFFKQLRSDMKNDALYKQIYNFYLCSDAAIDDIKKAVYKQEEKEN